MHVLPICDRRKRNQDGNVERALRHKGNVASADDWRSVMEPVIARYRPRKIDQSFRGDAAFAIPGMYDLLVNGGLKVQRPAGQKYSA